MTTGLELWHGIVKTRDTAALDRLLSDTVVFHSPVVHTPQVGKAIARKYLEAALVVLNGPDFKYVGACTEGTRTVLEFQTTVENVHVNGVDIITWSADGRQIVDFKVMVRPLKAINILHQAMGQLLSQLPGKP